MFDLTIRRRMKLSTLLVPAMTLVLVASPASAAAAPEGAVNEFSIPSDSYATDIAAGPDGNLWFTAQYQDQIGRITPSGEITEFTIPTANSDPYGITAGPDGNLWFTESNRNKIGRITPSGAITEFTIPTASSEPYEITAGPDGNLWFTEHLGGKIGRITPSGAITEFKTPTANMMPYGITAGPDGNLWFTEDGYSDKIGRITPSGAITEFTIPTANSTPYGITAGPDGNLWFTENHGNSIGRITPTGAFTEFAVPTSGSQPTNITAGPDGSLWFTEYEGRSIGRITPGGAITEFVIPPTGLAYPWGIAAGPDGNLWFADQENDQIGEIGAGSPAASIAPPAVVGSAQSQTQQVCEGDRWNDWAGQQPSLSEFGFDGYQWLRDGSPIAGQTSRSYTPSSGDVGHTLSCEVTVSYPLLGVTTSASSPTVTVIVPASGPQGVAGANGAQGQPGAPGQAGQVELVSCTTSTQTVAKKLHGKRHSRKVSRQVCQTKLVAGPVKFTAAAHDDGAALSRDGIIYATGYAHLTRAGAQVRLLASRHLARGRYTLTITRRQGHRLTHIQTQTTIR